ncbi:MAG: hypothetical protein ACI9JD_000708 [Rhodococcus sp. (in: high G+C Gram-positive bacteria)]|jgi:hypothetical protein
MQVAVAFGETRVRYKQRSYSQNIRVTELLVDIISVIGDNEGHFLGTDYHRTRIRVFAMPQ